MPFIPHTEQDVAEMLAAIDVHDISQLFDEIPSDIPKADIAELPMGCTEMEIARLMTQRAPQHAVGSCFIGAGAYAHYIPASVWQLASRGEFYTAYTPYQAEASQGSLQLIYEYQTMMAELMAMEVANASLYDGATALAEACLMAVRLHKKTVDAILLPETVHPAYHKVLTTILKQQNIRLITVKIDVQQGIIDMHALAAQSVAGVAALIIPQPNFFGCLEAVDALTDWAHAQNLLVIAVVNPIAMALLTPPGEWGEQGADIVCGEGQPLGVPLSYGGPYFGFMCCKKAYVRQMPGRIVGKTHDQQGRDGYTLTLQAREQHIRRGKATSNICTNQGLLVVAATIYMSLLGAAGLYEVALCCHQSANYLRQQLIALPGVTALFSAVSWHEFAIQVSQPINPIVAFLREHGIQAGYVLAHYENALLICVTETKTQQDLDEYVACFAAALKQ